ncbi:hypothetical protein SAMN02910456_00221 [Ruminococcaceae bacterium YRB3002]|nr:hypothetical protein SAMN02910456_00221 [Ruminococcaceae bacterium YRB3002]
MRSTNNVRSPNLLSSGAGSDKTKDLSLGDTLRKAKKDLFFTRCVYGMIAVMAVTAVFFMFYLGYVDLLVEWFYSLM